MLRRHFLSSALAAAAASLEEPADGLRRPVGAERVARPAQPMGRVRKPYLSAVCRYLGVWPPISLRYPPRHGAVDHAVGDRYLTLIRQHLAAHTAGR